MCDFCNEYRTEEHECARCGRLFCLDCGYHRYNETGESDWICYECDGEIAREVRTFAQGECPNCGHDWTAHSAWIANPGDTTCEEIGG